jgi:predicted nucleic acid-binding protein
MSPDPTPISFLDTSFVVRYLTGDPAPLSRDAAAVIDGQSVLALGLLVLVEAAYVLESVYQVPRQQVVGALGALVHRRNVVTPDLPKPAILTALELCRGSRRVSYVDALTWAQARHAGAEHVYTFDRRFPSEGLLVGPSR